MKWKLLAVLLCLQLNTAEAQSTFKQEVLNGYMARCSDVMGKNGEAEDIIQKVCQCEVNIIADNFNTFEFMLLLSKKMAGTDPADTEKITALKQKIKQCKVTGEKA